MGDMGQSISIGTFNHILGHDALFLEHSRLRNTFASGQVQGGIYVTPEDWFQFGLCLMAKQKMGLLIKINQFL